MPMTTENHLHFQGWVEYCYSNHYHSIKYLVSEMAKHKNGYCLKLREIDKVVDVPPLTLTTCFSLWPLLKGKLNLITVEWDKWDNMVLNFQPSFCKATGLYMLKVKDKTVKAYQLVKGARDPHILWVDLEHNSEMFFSFWTNCVEEKLKEIQ